MSLCYMELICKFYRFWAYVIELKDDGKVGEHNIKTPVKHCEGGDMEFTEEHSQALEKSLEDLQSAHLWYVMFDMQIAYN